MVPSRRLTVLRTPVEVGGGRKLKLIKNGDFKDIDVSMMVHTFPKNFCRANLYWD